MPLLNVCSSTHIYNSPSNPGIYFSVKHTFFLIRQGTVNMDPLMFSFHFLPLAEGCALKMSKAAGVGHSRLRLGLKAAFPSLRNVSCSKGRPRGLSSRIPLAARGLGSLGSLCTSQRRPPNRGNLETPPPAS